MEDNTSNQPMVKCSLNGVQIEALIDTGSMKSILHKSVFDKISLHSPPVINSSCSNQCVSVTGQSLRSYGEFQGQLQFSDGGHIYDIPLLVCDNLLEPLQCILGWDFLKSNHLELALDQSQYFIVGHHGHTPVTPVQSSKKSGAECDFPTFEQCATRGPVKVKLVSSIVIPPGTEIIVAGLVSKSAKNTLGMVTPISSGPSDLHSAYSVCNSNNRSLLIRLLNTGQERIELQKGAKIAEFCPVVYQPSNSDQNNDHTQVVGGVFKENQETIHELKSAISPILSEHDQKALLSTLSKYLDVFDNKLGHTSVVTHSIDTGDSPPICQRPRRMPYAYRQDAQSQIEEMLEQKVIKPSASPWASPIVLVRKKDGKYRFCVDYRKLNSVTKREARPLPRVDDLLESLQGYNLFSTLDLRSGYWQLSMTPEDQEKTAFATPAGLWEFLRMPFGLSGAPASFDRAIKLVMSGLNYSCCLCYFDDIIVPSNGIEQHCERLETVLSRLQQHNLKVKASKCTFGAPKVSYLGHTVSTAGVHTDMDKVKAVMKLSPPSNVEQVRSFLGLAGYYRKFIPNFATVALPLTMLTKKSIPFSWGQAQIEAFATLKQALCSAPVLAYPQLDRPFKLQTDASDYGIGAVLAQVDSQGQERVISYASRTLDNREKNYSAMEKEALAVVFAINHFRVYLLGRQFHLVTDNRALTWLHSLEPKGRIARWVMDVQEFDFIVSHRPGKKNLNADALSRLVTDPDTIESISPAKEQKKDSMLTAPTCFVSLTPHFNLQDAQVNDPDIQLVIQFKKNEMPKPPLFAWLNNPMLRSLWNCWDELHLSDELLVRSIPSKYGTNKRVIVLPKCLVPRVLLSLHSGPAGGHMGIRRTLSRAKERFFWPKMQETISQYVQSCPECMQSKTCGSQGKAPLQPIIVSEPFVFWAMDYMGPLPETSRGNKHLLVVGDHFTKWCEAFPTKNQKSETVAQILVSKLFSRFGPPDAIHSDQGANFESNLMHEIYNIMGIHKTRTTAYHPQCDGQVERQNRTIQEILSSFVAEHPADWDLFVDMATYAYNTSRNETTGFSPYELVFGREPRLPLEVDLGVPLKNPSTQSEYSQNVRQSIQSAQLIAQKNIKVAKNRQALSYDRGKKVWQPFEPSQWVWLRRPKKWKFGKKWIGPYQIIVRTGVNYKIISKFGKTTTAHHDQLKLCPLPASEGQPVAPVPEIGDIYIQQPEIHIRQGEGGQGAVQRRVRPQNLRQVINPPIRYGDVVTH